MRWAASQFGSVHGIGPGQTESPPRAAHHSATMAGPASKTKAGGMSADNVKRSHAMSIESHLAEATVLASFVFALSAALHAARGSDPAAAGLGSTPPRAARGRGRRGVHPSRNDARRAK